MACTKQMARKSDNKGRLPSQSCSGHTLATFANRHSPRFLDSDSDIERAANMFGVSPHGSPARGSKRLATPSNASPHKSPRLSSPSRGSPVRGSPAWGTPGQGAGRGRPVGMVNPQPTTSSSSGGRGGGGRPSQAGFVNCGGSSRRGATRCSPWLVLPSFSTEEDDNNNNNDDNDDNENEEDNNDDEEEVDFPNQGNRGTQRQRQTTQGGKQQQTPIATKNLNPTIYILT